MKTLTRPLMLCAVVAITAASAASNVDSSDIDAVRQVQAQQADAWNRHDPAAYAALFANDGDVVNVLGWWWQGRAAIQSKLTSAFAWVFRDSVLTINDVQVRMLTPSIAVARVQWRMEGAKAPPGAAQSPRQGMQLQVLQKKRGKWLIESFQNTNAFPETPFPTSPTLPATARP